MWVLWCISLILFGCISAIEVRPEIEVSNCTDPNAEYRNDNPACVVTCKRLTLMDTPDDDPCYHSTRPSNKWGCYCKGDYYYNDISKKCVKFLECPCKRKDEMYRYNNECGNNCATKPIRGICSSVTTGKCWCRRTYCLNTKGVCVPEFQL